MNFTHRVGTVIGSNAGSLRAVTTLTERTALRPRRDVDLRFVAANSAADYARRRGIAKEI
jgi:hypothetical protein